MKLIWAIASRGQGLGQLASSDSLALALRPLLPEAECVIAVVGAGGKTSALFQLAREFRAIGRRVLVTSTTHMAVPVDGTADAIVLCPWMEFPLGQSPFPPMGFENPPFSLLFARLASEKKLRGIHPGWIRALLPQWDLILVEADGSRRLPVKAPASHEPVIPDCTDLVLGVVGLDCLGRSMTEETVHRPDLFARVTGCGPGCTIEWKHLVALTRHPEGLFKGVSCKKAVILNKADRALFLPTHGHLLELEADLAAVCSLGGDEP